MIDKLNNGEEVYLCKNGKDIFKAKFKKTPLGTMVHGQELDADSGRFFILKILKDANNWKKFDVDKHCVGAPIKWDIKNVRQSKQKNISELGTEARFATPQAERESWILEIGRKLSRHRGITMAKHTHRNYMLTRLEDQEKKQLFL